jgi:DNA-3-methyladenine glycosylase II
VSRIDITPVHPYSLTHTTGAFGRFPDECVDRLIDGKYVRAFRTGSTVQLIEASQDEASDVVAPVQIRLVSDTGSTSLEPVETMRRILAIDESVEDVYVSMNQHPQLQWLAKKLEGLRRTIDPTPFEGLVSSILAQLISIRGASVVRRRFVQHFSTCIQFEGADFWMFPEPGELEGVSVDELCSLGMTRAKAKAILEVARLCRSGELELSQLETQADRDVHRHLTSISGIGPWTADWFLVNVLGRMSVVPVGDLGIRRSTGAWLLDGRMPDPAEVDEVYRPFGEVRGYVAYYVLSAERYRLAYPGD